MSVQAPKKTLGIPGIFQLLFAALLVLAGGAIATGLKGTPETHDSVGIYPSPKVSSSRDGDTIEAIVSWWPRDNTATIHWSHDVPPKPKHIPGRGVIRTASNHKDLFWIWSSGPQPYDGKSKVTLVAYFYDPYNEPRSRCAILINGKEEKDYQQDLTPVAGNTKVTCTYDPSKPK